MKLLNFQRNIRFSEEMKLQSNEHLVENFKLSLFKSFISEVVYVYLAGKICRVTLNFLCAKNVQRVPR